jgi:hypothetical protein
LCLGAKHYSSTVKRFRYPGAASAPRRGAVEHAESWFKAGWRADAADGMHRPAVPATGAGRFILHQGQMYLVLQGPVVLRTWFCDDKWRIHRAACEARQGHGCRVARRPAGRAAAAKRVRFPLTESVEHACLRGDVSIWTTAIDALLDRSVACQLGGDGSRRTVTLWPARVPGC